MGRKSKADYIGIYKIKHNPLRMTKHTQDSWELIENVIKANNNQADFVTLEDAVIDHVSGTKTAPHPYQFVTYCIRRGWLERVEDK